MSDLTALVEHAFVWIYDKTTGYLDYIRAKRLCTACNRPVLEHPLRRDERKTIEEIEEIEAPSPSIEQKCEETQK